MNPPDAVMPIGSGGPQGPGMLRGATSLLTDTYEKCIFIHMRTTLNIDDKLLGEASRMTGVGEKTSLVRMGLEALIYQEAAKRLAAMGGSDPKAYAAPRKRPWNRRK